MRTRPMTEDDIATVAELEATNTLEPWSDTLFQEELQLGSYCRILEDCSGTLIGYSVARLQWDEWHLLTLGVAPSYRRRGGARLLLKELCHQAATDGSRAIILEVRASNEPARKLYQDMGFHFLYTRKAYYRLGLETEEAMVLGYHFVERNVGSSACGADVC